MPKHSKKTVNKVRELNRDSRLTTKDIAKKCKLTVGQVNYILYQVKVTQKVKKLRWVAHPEATVPLQKMSLKTYFDKKDADNLAKIENQEPETVGGRLSRFFKTFLGG
jgi:hypothetical protein